MGRIQAVRVGDGDQQGGEEERCRDCQCVKDTCEWFYPCEAGNYS